jgi:hypothetical protein
MPSFGREVKLWVPCRIFTARKRSLAVSVEVVTFLARSFPPSLIEGSVRPEQFEVPQRRERAARSEWFGAIHHEMAAHSERFGAPLWGAAGSVGMDAPGDDGGI